MDIYTIILIIHVIFGFSALVTGAIAMTVKKQKGNHTRTGWIYNYSMLGVFITVVMLFSIKGMPILFLLLIGYFSEYQVLSGTRYLQISNRLKNLKWYDYTVVYIGLIVGALMISFGIYYAVNGESFGASLLIVFGLIMTSTSTEDARFISSLSKGMKIKHKPIIMHIRRMGGGYIATFTAFFVNNLGSALPFYIGWFLPGIVGGILIGRTVRKWSGNKKSRVQSNPVS